MRFGIWTPLPHTIRHDDALTAAIAEATRVGPVDGPDKALEIATETLQTGEALGFVTTLIAARHSGPDLDAWLLASALATRTSAIELIVAVHPGIHADWGVRPFASTFSYRIEKPYGPMYRVSY